MRKQKKYHFIYRTTCSITGRFYVGMHSTDNLDDGYLGSGKILGYSRRKHGDENHKLEILEHCSSRDELKRREAEVVNEELLADPLNINLKYGGEGGWTLESTLKGNSSPKRNRKEIQAKIKATLELRGKKHFNGMSGFKGHVPDWNGRAHTEIGRKNISEGMKNKQAGEKNSQFGTCWVTNGVKPVKIQKEQLDEYLKNGYSRGRKCIHPGMGEQR